MSLVAEFTRGIWKENAVAKLLLGMGRSYMLFGIGQFSGNVVASSFRRARKY